MSAHLETAARARSLSSSIFNTKNASTSSGRGEVNGEESFTETMRMYGCQHLKKKYDNCTRHTHTHKREHAHTTILTQEDLIG